MADLSHTIALVTGGAQGIGRSFVEHLLAVGAKVAIGDLNRSVGENTQKELAQKYSGKVIFVPCDVTNAAEFEDAVKGVIKKFGSINLIVNNAGIANESDRGWSTMVRINVDGLVRGTKLGFKYMSKANGGSGGTVINIASITTFTPWDPIPVYSGTKAFVNQFSRSYGSALHYDPSGVKVIAINPGITDTAILQIPSANLIEDSEEHFKSVTSFIQSVPIQKVDNMGRGLITVLQKGENGSLWVVENEEPAKLVKLEYSSV